MYFAAYSTHIACVALSGSLFLLRGYWMIKESAALELKAVRVTPHVIDTALLASAIIMLIQLELNPIDAPWLIVKLFALLAYIGLGLFALRRGRTKAIRLACFLAAVATFSFMVTVALTKHPAGAISYLFLP